MIKFSVTRKKKALILSLSFIFAYILSTLVTTLLIYKNLNSYIQWNAPPIVIGSFAIVMGLFLTRLYASSFRHASIPELMKTAIVAFFVFIANLLVMCIRESVSFLWCVLCTLLFFFIATIGVSLIRIFKFTKAKILHKGYQQKVLIVGAGVAGATILREILLTDKIDLSVVGLIDDDENKIGSYILGVRVLGTTEQITEIAKETEADLIIIAIPSATAKQLKVITNRCIQTKCKVKMIPGLYQLIDGTISFSRLRDVDVEDLLGREPVKCNLDEIMGYIENKTVLVTGGGGSIGSELCRQIATHSPKRLIILDIYENNAYDIEQELKRRLPELDLVTLIASVRDKTKIDDVFKTYRPEIVFHAAAHKHVPLMETSPNEAVKNNILGTYNVVAAADKYEVLKFVQISTDKAVNPTNIMGATKRACEMIIQAFAKRSKTCFVAVRFGNVLGSNGSVIPLFKKQIAEGGPVTVTHKDIIRYFMTIPEAVSLVLQAGAYAKGGEIFVLDMGEQVKIYDLATNLIRLSGYEPGVDIEIKVTGLRPGEKLYEERLMAEEGLTRTQNDRISIGKPLEIDEDKLFNALDRLKNEAYAESDKMKEIVKELVPTYIIDKR